MIGLLFVMFGVYLLLAFSSFLVSGGHDQSLVMHAETGELLRTDNGIQNVMGSSGAQLSQFLVNDCFGLASYIIIVFLIIAGMRPDGTPTNSLCGSGLSVISHLSSGCH